MMATLQAAVRCAHLGLIRAASLAVPARKRAEWLQEWRAELWYAGQECFSEGIPDLRSIWRATAFCFGAFCDAFFLQRRSWQGQRTCPRTLARIRGSASWSLALLSAIFFSAWGIARVSPRVNVGMSTVHVYTWQPADPRALPCDCAMDLTISGRPAQTVQQFFDGFAHYTIAQQTVSAPGVARSDWTIAHAGLDFFRVLQLPVSILGRAGGSPQVQVVLSRDRWIHDFHGDPDIAGTRMHVGSVEAVIAGIALGNSAGLPGRADAWLLDSVPRAPAGGQVFVAGHLSPAGYFNEGCWTLSLGGIFLAFVTLPFITNQAMSGYSWEPARPSPAQRYRFWTFLLARAALLLAIAYYTSMDFAFSLLQPYSQFSGYFQCGTAFAICLAGLSWVFRDQQRRCPVCLRRMEHAAEVGDPSRTFLAWSGTELVCASGHALLHIPGTPTSWFAGPRWVCLDGSWQFLFVRSS
jgi:hypothetical protein